MNREIKLALILGSALVLIVGVLLSDHYSGVRRTPIVTVGPEVPLTAVVRQASTTQPGPDLARADHAPANTELNRALLDPVPQPAPADVPNTDAALADPVERQAQIVALQDRRLIEEAKQQGIEIAAPAPVRPEPARSAVASAKEHTVKAGETLWEIAQKHYGDGSQYKKIVDANKDRLTGGVMAAGVRLRIPPKAGAADSASVAAAPAPELAKPETVSKAAKPSDKPAADKPQDKAGDKNSKRVYTVRSGDTLVRIAERQLGSPGRARELASLNGIKDPDDLSVGRELKLPPR